MSREIVKWNKLSILSGILITLSSILFAESGILLGKYQGELSSNTNNFIINVMQRQEAAMSYLSLVNGEVVWSGDCILYLISRVDNSSLWQSQSQGRLNSCNNLSYVALTRDETIKNINYYLEEYNKTILSNQVLSKQANEDFYYFKGFFLLAIISGFAGILIMSYIFTKRN